MSFQRSVPQRQQRQQLLHLDATVLDLAPGSTAPLGFPRIRRMSFCAMITYPGTELMSAARSILLVVLLLCTGSVAPVWGAIVRIDLNGAIDPITAEFVVNSIS